MSFKSRTPKKEECITPMQIAAKDQEQSRIIHCHNYEKLSDGTKAMIDKIVKKASEL